MEKAVLKTLIYADIFDYPLKIFEIHKWLFGRKSNLRQVEKALHELVKNKKCKAKNGYYFFPGREAIVAKRKRKEKQSASYFRKAKILSQIFKIVPWAKLVGISGGLAMENAGKKDDIDLFIVTAKDRLWISRLLILGLLSLLGQRRKRGDLGRKIAGKLCINILLEEDKLEQKNKDIFTAHEVLQMKVLWQRDWIYSKYLEENSWAFKFLPNWVGDSFDVSLRAPKGRGNLPTPRKIASSLSLLAMTGIENIAKRFQLSIMQKPKGMERIEEGALYFHPQDCRLEVLQEYKKKISNP